MTAPIRQADLPLMATVVRSYQLFREKLPLFWRLAPAWAALICALEWLGSTADAKPVQMLTGMVVMAVVVGFMVGWHRLVLLSEVRPVLGFVRFDRRSAQILLIWLLVFVGVLLVVATVLSPFAALTGPASGPQIAKKVALLALIFVVAFGLVMARLTVALPAISVDDWQTGVARSWKLSGSSWQTLFLGNLAVSVPTNGLMLLILGVAGAMPGPAQLVLGFVAVIAQLSSIALMAGFSALAYDFLVRGGGPQPRPRLDIQV